MNIIHNKDIGTKQKALAINLTLKFTAHSLKFGAGQDVAAISLSREPHPAPSPKPCRLMIWFSLDAIYGVQQHRRYVSEARLISMLEREYGLLIERLAGTAR